MVRRGGHPRTRARCPLELWLENHEDEALAGELSLEIIGLGARRVLELGSITVAPKSMRAIPWSPSKSPIAPVGATARLYARVAFERGGVGARIPAQILSLAFSEDRSKAFLSSTDDTGVRLASLGRASAGLHRSSLTRDDKTALLGTLGGRSGTVDGAALPPSQAKSSETVSLPLKREWLDTIELDEGAAHDKDLAASGASLNDLIPIVPPPCNGSPVTMPICARWARRASATSGSRHRSQARTTISMGRPPTRTPRLTTASSPPGLGVWMEPAAARP